MRSATMTLAACRAALRDIAAGLDDEPVVLDAIQEALVDVVSGATARVPQDPVGGRAGVALGCGRVQRTDEGASLAARMAQRRRGGARQHRRPAARRREVDQQLCGSRLHLQTEPRVSGPAPWDARPVAGAREAQLAGDRDVVAIVGSR